MIKSGFYLPLICYFLSQTKLSEAVVTLFVNNLGFSLELSVSIRLLFTILQGFSTSFFFLEIFKSIIAANVPITANTIIKRKIARYPAAPSYASRSLPHIGLIKTSGVNPIKETIPIAVPVTCRGIFASSIVAQ